MSNNHSAKSSAFEYPPKTLDRTFNLPSFPVNDEQESNWNLQDFLFFLQRRKLIISSVSIAVMISTITVLILNPVKPEYEEHFQILVEAINDGNKTIDVGKQSDPNQPGLDYDSQVQVLKSPVLLRDVIKQLQANYPDISYESLIENLKVSQLEKTKIIQVTYRSYDPNQVGFVLNKLADYYIKYSQEKRQTQLRQSIQFVEQQLKGATNRLNQIQKQLLNLKQRYSFNSIESETDSLASATKTLSEQQQTVNLQLVQSRANLAILQKENGKKSALNNATLYQDFLSQANKLNTQLAAESTRLQDDNPTLQSLKVKRDSLLPLINQEAKRFLDTKRAEVATQIQLLEVQSQELAKREQELDKKRKQLPIISKQYTEMQQRLQVATESVNRFLSTRENLQIQKSQTEFGWQIIQAPVRPEYPVTSSSFIFRLFSAFAVSITIGVFGGLLRDRIDNTYNTANDLKAKVKLPLLGSIPIDDEVKTNRDQNFVQNIPIPSLKLPNNFSKLQREPNVANFQEKSNYFTYFLEALRLLYTNIQLLNSDRQIRSIVISSAMPGDGKSTIAFNLAQIAATMGQKVLIVDGDMRRPVVHSLANLNNLWGLSNLISTDSPVAKAIQKLPSLSNLSVITAGSIPPDPTKLISSEKMKRLMEEFHQNFDLVIYDVPPLAGIADASLLATNTDGILLVVKIGKTQSSVLEQVLENLNISHLNVLGVVANGEKPNFQAYY
ncbi:MAG: polysaccharide biosynthesis tyrosine autokinase [Nostoc sp. TH1S01]|nr:polysaccharide biosynthesis tyrosine autokinase [Nostoc sp. TH1S01]